MNEQNKKKIIVMAVLLVAAGVFVVRAIFFAGPPPNYQMPDTAKQAADAAAAGAGAAPAAASPSAPAGAAAATPGSPTAGVNLEELAKNVKVVDFQYDPAIVARNPMTPLVGPEAIIAAAAAAAGDASAQSQQAVDTSLLTQQMAVTGIVWDKKFPVAVINNDVVAPGDVLANGIVVKSIEPSQVTLSINDNTITLPLKQLEEQ
ncbi:MAG: hypothetical protein RBU21_14275 [FCB group bacterium]|jgi:hypothetical protein|nr:hypothetical protein [FCB group bacterium]